MRKRFIYILQAAWLGLILLLWTMASEAATETVAVESADIKTPRLQLPKYRDTIVYSPGNAPEEAQEFSDFSMALSAAQEQGGGRIDIYGNVTANTQNDSPVWYHNTAPLIITGYGATITNEKNIPIAVWGGLNDKVTSLIFQGDLALRQTQSVRAMEIKYHANMLLNGAFIKLYGTGALCFTGYGCLLQGDEALQSGIWAESTSAIRVEATDIPSSLTLKDIEIKTAKGVDKPAVLVDGSSAKKDANTGSQLTIEGRVCVTHAGEASDAITLAGGSSLTVRGQAQLNAIQTSSNGYSEQTRNAQPCGIRMQDGGFTMLPDSSAYVCGAAYGIMTDTCDLGDGCKLTVKNGGMPEDTGSTSHGGMRIYNSKGTTWAKNLRFAFYGAGLPLQEE